jgi:thiamine-phosphate pyrophosphorylase
MKIARPFGVRIIVNDRLDIALAAGADGVHLGQDDLSPAKARALVGSRFIIGYSTHSITQALNPGGLAADYIAIGPIFATSTKKNPDPAVGLEVIRELKPQLQAPLVAIGGITLARAPEVLAAGADSVAVISDLFTGGDVAGRTHDYLSTLRG